MPPSSLSAAGRAFLDSLSLDENSALSATWSALTKRKVTSIVEEINANALAPDIPVVSDAEYLELAKRFTFHPEDSDTWLSAADRYKAVIGADIGGFLAVITLPTASGNPSRPILTVLDMPSIPYIDEGVFSQRRMVFRSGLIQATIPSILHREIPPFR